MTCKDCVHYDACCGWASKRYVEDSFDDCPHFKPKSRFVELPCEVGQTVWEINTDNPFEEDLRVMETKIERFFVGTSLDIHSMDCFGKTVFLSREEAENALQRKEDEGK